MLSFVRVALVLLSLHSNRTVTEAMASVPTIRNNNHSRMMCYNFFHKGANSKLIARVISPMQLQVTMVVA